MRVEYEAIAAAGFQVQVDDAWLGALWDRIGIPMGLDGYRKYCQMRCEALNHALRNIPEEQIRYHLCWGSWHGPHSADLPLPDVIDIMLRSRPRPTRSRPPTCATSTRSRCGRHQAARRQDPRARCRDPLDTADRAPAARGDRIQRFAELVGRENVIASTDCGLGLRLHPSAGVGQAQRPRRGRRAGRARRCGERVEARLSGRLTEGRRRRRWPARRSGTGWARQSLGRSRAG